MGALAGGYAGAAVGTLIGDATTSGENYDPTPGLIGGGAGFVLVAAPLTYFSIKNFRQSTRLRRRLQVDAYATRNGAQIGVRGRF